MYDLERFHWQLRLNRTTINRQRDLVFLAIARHQPINSVNLVAVLAGQVGRATVYRSIPKFEAAGILERDIGGVVRLTDRFRQHAHSRACRACGRHDYFWDNAIEQALQRQAHKFHFQLEEHRLQLVGLCQQCQMQEVARAPVGDNYRRQPARLSSRDVQ